MKSITITKCAECPRMVMGADFQRRCMPVGTLIDRMDVQPDWCPLEAAPKPKRLVWSRDGEDEFCNTPFVLFRVYKIGADYRAQKSTYGWGACIGYRHETAEEAKAACQAEFDRIWFEMTEGAE